MWGWYASSAVWLKIYPGRLSGSGEGLGLEFDAERFHDRDGGLEGRIAVLAERTVELLAGQAGLLGDLRHALRARHDAERVGGLSSVAAPAHTRAAIAASNMA